MLRADHFHVDLHLPHLTVSWLCHIQGEQKDRHQLMWTKFVQPMPKILCAQVFYSCIYFYTTEPAITVIDLDFDMLIVSFLGKDGGLNRCRNDWKWRRTGNVDRASVLKSSLVKALAVAKFLVHNCFCYSAHQHSFLGLSWFNIGKSSFFLFLQYNFSENAYEKKKFGSIT